MNNVQTVLVNFKPGFDPKPLLDGLLLTYSVLFEDIESKGERRNTYSVMVTKEVAGCLVLDLNARPEVNYAELAPIRKMME